MRLTNFVSCVLVGVVGLIRAEFDTCINNEGVAVSLLQRDLALKPMIKAKNLEIQEHGGKPLFMYAFFSNGSVDVPPEDYDFYRGFVQQHGGVLVEDNSTLVDTACKPLQRPAAARNTVQSFCLSRQTQPRANIGSLIAELGCPAEPAINSAFRQIDSLNISLNYDFIANHSGGLEPSDVAEFGTFRFDISDRQVDISDWYPLAWGWNVVDSTLTLPKMLLDVAKEVRLPNVSFVLSSADGSPAWNSIKLLPVTPPKSWKVRAESPAEFRAPAPGVWRTEGRPGVDILSIPRSLTDWGATVRAMLNAIPNASYTPKSFAVFRGGDTGLGWRQQIRSLAQRRPDLIDANTSFLTDEQQMRFEVVLVPDGNSVSDRLARQMAYGKPVVLIHPRKLFNEFWYPELQPWVHYVPSSGVDLETTLEILQKDPALAYQIGVRGKQFVEERFTERRMRCYMYRLLEEYAARFKG